MARKKKADVQFQNEVLISIYALIILALSIIGVFRFGLVGRTLYGVLRVIFGQFPELFFVLFFALGLWVLIRRTKFRVTYRYLIAVLLVLVSVLIFLSTKDTYSDFGFGVLSRFFSEVSIIFKDTSSPAYGGVVGAFLYSMLSILFDPTGTYIVLVVFILVALMLVFGPNILVRVFGKVKLPKLPEKKEKPLKSESKTIISPIEADDPLVKPEKEEFKVRSMSDALTQEKLNVEPIEIHHDASSKSVFLSADENEQKEGGQKKNLESGPVETKSSGVHEGILNYKLPSLAILDKPVLSKRSSANRSSAESKGERLIEILKEFGIEAELIATHIGPSVTKFEIKPNSNVKISRIQSVQDNLMMELAVKELRIEAPIPGKNAVGIEIPNIEMTPVRLSELLTDVPSEYRNKKLLVALGKDLMGKSVFAQLDKMPHLLIAGATGSGKSVCVNSLIASLILRTTPDEVKMLLIDPKKVEFTTYKDIPHLICPVISDPLDASRALKVVVKMMENRYDLFSKVGVRNITGYNELLIKNPQDHLAIMPWIVVIIDELADLMSVAGKEVESSIQRITQLARAAGIHLVVATQRPSVDVITGVIKANIPSRIAFAVSSAIDSRTILDMSGAEKLLGYGDMLYVPIGEPNPTRIQGVFISDDEVKRVADSASAQAKPTFEDAFIQLEGVEGNEGIVSISDDPIYEECKSYVIETQKASTSLLQRRFQLGYNRAARIIEALEEDRIIGPQQGSKPRDVYIKNDAVQDDE